MIILAMNPFSLDSDKVSANACLMVVRKNAAAEEDWPITQPINNHYMDISL